MTRCLAENTRVCVPFTPRLFHLHFFNSPASWGRLRGACEGDVCEALKVELDPEQVESRFTHLRVNLLIFFWLEMVVA